MLTDPPSKTSNRRGAPPAGVRAGAFSPLNSASTIKDSIMTDAAGDEEGGRSVSPKGLSAAQGSAAGRASAAGWTLPRGTNAFYGTAWFLGLWIPSTEGRSVGLSWAKSKPKGPKGFGGIEFECILNFSRGGGCFLWARCPRILPLLHHLGKARERLTGKRRTGLCGYKGTSLIRSASLGPYSRTMPRALRQF